MLLRFLIGLLTLALTSSAWAGEKPPTIGCVLPLSGKYSVFGNKTLHGIELALLNYNATEAGKKRPVNLIIKDSQGTAAGAAKAVEELDKEGADAIIGPILSGSSESAAKKAQQLGIPVITMTQKEGISKIGENVFRTGITNSLQVKGLVEYAVKQDAKKAVILYPDNPYGREMTTLFTERFTAAGGEIIGSQKYKDGQTDFGPEIRALIGDEFPKKMEEYNALKEKEFLLEEEKKKEGKPVRKKAKDEKKDEIERPRPPFDAVFIPDYAEGVGLLIPQIAYYDAGDVVLLGGSGWNSQKLIEMAGGYLSKAVFTDGFFAASSRPHVKTFVEQYRKTFNEEPGLLEAQAFDTMRMLLFVSEKGTTSRDDLKKEILNIKSFQGVSGDTSFTERDADRTVYLLTVVDKKIVELTEPK